MTSPASDSSALRDLMANAIVLAIDNIAFNGDTDVFPVSDETVALLGDRSALAIRVLALHDEFERNSAVAPPEVIRCLVPAGYLGQRIASQISPIWNAYYLALVIACAAAIERVRAPSDRVFSYRFVSPEPNGRIFDAAIGWTGFLDATRQACARYSHALVTDISDFYYRVRIATVADALDQAGVEDALSKRLIKVLHLFEVDRFGLPVGGPASRILAELALVRTDAQIALANIPFVRFVDDIRLFASSGSEAQRHLLTLANRLWEDGFSLQKSKTRILRACDLLEEMKIARATALSPIAGDKPIANDLELFPHDPYSELRAQIGQHLSQFASHPDVVSTIMRELSKSRLNLPLARNLLSALSYSPPEHAGAILSWLLDRADCLALVPVFGRVIEAIEANLGRLDPTIVNEIGSKLVNIAFSDVAVVMFDFYRALCVRLIGRFSIPDIDSLAKELAALDAITPCALVRREIASVRARIGITKARSVMLAKLSMD